MLKRNLTLFLLLAVLLVSLGYLAHHYRTKELVKRPMLPVVFEHIDHKEVACAKCHHNYIDDTGGGTCYSCHKHSLEISAQMEDMFHRFCRDCHLETRVKGEESGPLRSCAHCHEPGFKGG